MHGYDALIARLMVFFKDINLKVEPAGEEVRVMQTLGFINLPKACAAIEKLGWDAWLEQLLQKMNLPMAEATDPELGDGAVNPSTNGEMFDHSRAGTESDLEARE